MSDAGALLPLAILVLGAAVVLAFDRLFAADDRATAWLAAATALAAAAAEVIAGTGDDALGGLLRRDGAGAFLTTVLCAGAASAIALSAGSAMTRASAGRLAQMLVATAGGLLLIAAADLLLVFLALEIIFMSGFTLIAARHGPGGRDASRSWFLLCGTASALLGAGVALVWSVAGSFAIGALASLTSPVGQAGTALVLVGLACFAGLAPFHLWLLPALEATPLPTALLVAIVPRVAAFAALMRCASAISANGGSAIDWRACLAILAAGSIVAGSLGALHEISLRRIVAQLSLAFAGQITVAAAAGVGSSAAIGLALLAYVIVVVGMLGVIALPAVDEPDLHDLRGLARREPLVVAAIGIIAIGMAGLPPTIAFFARLAVFEGAAGSQLAWLVIVAAGATVLAAASAFRIAFACFESGEARWQSRRIATGIVAFAALLAFAGGIAPGPWLQLAQGVRF